jgi:hypothetical protein
VTETRLPKGFEALEPFVASWAVEGSYQRALQRSRSSAAELKSFYAAAKDLVPAALAHLDAKPLDGFDAREQRLMSLMLTFAHVACAVEIQGKAEPVLENSRKHMRITRAPSDGPAQAAG